MQTNIREPFELNCGDVIEIISTENEYLKLYIKNISKSNRFQIIAVNKDINSCTIQLSTGTYVGLNEMDIISKLNI